MKVKRIKKLKYTFKKNRNKNRKTKKGGAALLSTIATKASADAISKATKKCLEEYVNEIYNPSMMHKGFWNGFIAPEFKTGEDIELTKAKLDYVKTKIKEQQSTYVNTDEKEKKKKQKKKNKKKKKKKKKQKKNQKKEQKKKQGLSKKKKK